MAISGAVSFPVSGTGVPAHSSRCSCRSCSSSAAVQAQGNPEKGKIFVVVHSSTQFPPAASSSPSVRSSVVFPPPPMTAVIPGRIFSKPANSIPPPPFVLLFIE